ncbi:hypothetical protein AJ87_26835 [Rhizobium yanglingense]|nr:hypothetical protein AJ87_26835 [Rhizobium yanglingense]
MWGRKSINALKAFQKSRGLAVTGVVDELVIKELFPLDGVIEQLKARTPPINPDAEVTSKTPPSASDIPGKLDVSPVDKQPNPVAVEKSNRVESMERLPRVAAEQVLTVPETSADADQVQSTEPDNPERSNLGYALAASLFCLIAFVAVRRRRNKDRVRPIDIVGKAARPFSASIETPAIPVAANNISPDAFSGAAPSIADTTSIPPSAPIGSKVEMIDVLASRQVPFGAGGPSLLNSKRPLRGRHKHQIRQQPSTRAVTCRYFDNGRVDLDKWRIDLCGRFSPESGRAT